MTDMVATGIIGEHVMTDMVATGIIVRTCYD